MLLITHKDDHSTIMNYNDDLGRERNVDAALIGAQMLINDPEAAIEILLGSDIYPQLQRLQREGSESSTRENRGGGGTAGAENRHTTNTNTTDEISQPSSETNISQSLLPEANSLSAAAAASQSVFPVSLKTSLDSAVQSLLVDPGSALPPHHSQLQQGGMPQLGVDAATAAAASAAAAASRRDIGGLAEQHQSLNLGVLSGGRGSATGSSSQFDIEDSLRTALGSAAAVQQRAAAGIVRGSNADGTDALPGLSTATGLLDTSGGSSSELPPPTAGTSAAATRIQPGVDSSKKVTASTLPVGPSAYEAAVRSIIAGGVLPGSIHQQLDILSRLGGGDASLTDGSRQLSAVADLGGSNLAGTAASTASAPLSDSAGASSVPHHAQRVAAHVGGGDIHQPGANSRPPVMLYSSNDDASLSRYQCLVRKQIEMFEATDDDVQFNISRMSKIIVLGQVGIRCRHCAVLPEHGRPKAAVYYPRTLDSIYQFGQNMVKNHLLSSCELIPADTKAFLMSLQESRKRGRGGRERWARAAQEAGVVEDENGLRFEQRR